MGLPTSTVRMPTRAALIGPIVGCVLIQYITTWLGETKFADVNLVLGVILVVLVLFVPKGFVPLARDVLARITTRRDVPAAGE